MDSNSENNVGLAPGSAINVGPSAEATRITVLQYNETYVSNEPATDLNALQTLLKNAQGKIWINVEGLKNVAEIQQLCELFNIHSLVTEDILNTHQRAKMDVFDDYLFLVIRMRRIKVRAKKLKLEQLSIIIKENVLITFQESWGDVFDGVRKRLNNPQAKIRQNSVDYLAYALIDSIVDDYLNVVESQGTDIENLETCLIQKPSSLSLSDLYRTKRELITLRKTVLPIRDISGLLIKEEHGLIHPNTQFYMRDLYDHSLRLIDTIETYREMTASMLDIYLSSISNKTNQTMRILTIFATIFIPLTFITSLYGMNFQYMPELKWHYGYFATLGVMGFIALVLIIFFKIKKWF